MAIKMSGSALGTNVAAVTETLISFESNKVNIPGTLELSGALNLFNDLNITGNINIAGALNYSEENRTETNLFIEDKTIMVASGAAASANADGSGLLIGSGSHGEGYASILFDNGSSGFDVNVGGATQATLSSAGLTNLVGTINGDDNGARVLFNSMDSAGNALTLGGGADVVMGGDLKLHSNGIIEDSGGHTRFTATDAGGTILSDADGTAVLTVHASDLSTAFAGDISLASGATIKNNSSGANKLILTETTVVVSGALDGTGALKIGGDSNLIGDVTFGGHLVADGNENKSIFEDVSSQEILFGGANATYSFAGRQLAVTGNLLVNKDATVSKDLTVSEMLSVGRELLVTGNADFAADVQIDKDLTVTKDATITEHLNVGASLDVTGNATVGGDLTVNGRDVLIGADNAIDATLVFGHDSVKSVMGIDDSASSFVIHTNGQFQDTNDFAIDGNGNVTIANGDLAVSKDATITGLASVGSALDVTGTLKVAGDATFATDATITGLASVGSALDVTGTLKVAGDATFATDATITGLASVGSALNVTGTLRVGGNSTLAGDAAISKDLTVTENSFFTGSLNLGPAGPIFFKNAAGNSQAAAVLLGLAGGGAATKMGQGDLVLAAQDVVVTGAFRSSTDAVIGGDITIAGNTINFGNGATIENGDSNTLTITEATLAVAGNVDINGDTLSIGNVSMKVDDHVIELTGSGDVFDSASDPVLLRVPDGRAIQAGELLTYSDARLKKNIVEMDDDESLNAVMSMNPVSYDLKRTGRKQIGFLAQEMAQLYPEVCLLDKETGEGIGIDYTRLTSVLASALQAQQKQIESLKKAFVSIKK